MRGLPDRSDPLLRFLLSGSSDEVEFALKFFQRFVEQPDKMSDPKSAAASHLHEDETQRRQKPGFREFVRPRYFFSWLWAFIEGWFLSRNYRQLAIGLPFLLLVIAGPLFLLWLRSAPRDSLVAAYEEAVKESINEDDPERTGLYLESLVRLRPLRKAFRHQLVMHYVDQDQPKNAGSHITQLVGADGYVPTRLWLIEQAREPEPDFPLTPQQVDEQLSLILEREPLNTLANLRLAQRLLEKKQYKSVEDHLLKVVDEIPSLGLRLAEVQRILQRDEEQIQEHLALAEKAFQKQLIADSQDSETRVMYAQARVMQGDYQGAIELVEEGRRLQDGEKLKATHSELLLYRAGAKMRVTDFNSAAAAQDLRQAMLLQPTNLNLVRQALSLKEFGVQWSDADMQPTVDFLKSQADLPLADRMLLYEILVAGGRNTEALQVISKLKSPDLADEIVRADLLFRTKRQDEAKELLAELKKQLETSDRADREEKMIRVLLLEGKTSEARELAIQQLKLSADVSPDMLRQYQALFATANFSEYQRRLAEGGFEDAGEAIGMLLDPRQGQIKTVLAVSRLINLTTLEPDFKEEVTRTLKQLARNNRDGWRIDYMLGTYFLGQAESDPESLEDARTSLELAYQRNKTNPVLKNNLAVALVRSDRDLDRALQLAEEAIQQLEDKADAMSTRAEILVAQGKWQEARQDLEVALTARPDSLVIRRLLVKVLTELGEPGLAKEHQEAYDALLAEKKSQQSQAQPTTSHQPTD